MNLLNLTLESHFYILMEENINRLRPNGQRAKTAIILIWIVFGIEILSMISGYLQYSLVKSAQNGAVITTSSATLNDMREGIIGVIYMVAFITSAVIFIRWFRRAYFNLHILTNGLLHKEGWAAGAWFVPIVNLFMPYQIMKELYVESNKVLVAQEQPQRLKVANVGWWWTFWIASNIAGQVIFRVSKSAETLEELSNASIISIISNIVGIVLALIAVKIISDYAKIEPLLGEQTESLVDDAILDSGIIDTEIE